MQIDIESIFTIKNSENFNDIALQIFRFQANNNVVYKSFIDYLNIVPENIHSIEKIPYLPVSFFKSHEIICPENAYIEQIFLSSATTGTIQSKHLIHNLEIYTESFRKGFEHFYGKITDYCLLALLPSYQEREGSSLIFMIDDLIHQSGHPHSGYFLNDEARLIDTLKLLRQKNQKTILIGVTYALLDLVEKHFIDFPALTVMETGGMKGRRKELVRAELHQILENGFNVSAIHSEYGMTELLSQAYSLGKGIFACPPWMRVSSRDINDPLSAVETGKTGGLNIVDLSNLHSCSFIATQDLGKVFSDGTFEVLGRFDNSDIRGCNLLVQ